MDRPQDCGDKYVGEEAQQREEGQERVFGGAGDWWVPQTLLFSVGSLKWRGEEDKGTQTHKIGAEWDMG